MVRRHNYTRTSTLVVARRARVLCVAGVCGCVPHIAAGQSDTPTFFVANNGNLVGAVTSLGFDTNRRPVILDTLLIQERPSGSPSVPGTNAYEIAISADGKYVATTHATASQTTEQLTIIRVDTDATLHIAGIFQVPDSPLDVVWMGDRRLAIAKASISGTNEIGIYDLDDSGPVLALTERDREQTGGFSTYLFKHPTLDVVYTQDSNSPAKTEPWFVDTNGALASLGAMLTAPVYSLEIAVSPNGRLLYTTGGISSGGHSINGFDVDVNGGVLPAAGSPYTSPGTSPADIAVSPDSQFVICGHGTDATARTFTVGTNGELTSTGFGFDVGTQGTLGDIQAMVVDSVPTVIVSDNSSIDNNWGVYAFTLGSQGELVANGPIVPLVYQQANSMATWTPDAGCYADCDSSGALNIFDYICFGSAYSALQPYADCDGSGAYNIFDYICFGNAYSIGCP